MRGEHQAQRMQQARRARHTAEALGNMARVDPDSEYGPGRAALLAGMLADAGATAQHKHRGVSWLLWTSAAMQVGYLLPPLPGCWHEDVAVEGGEDARMPAAAVYCAGLSNILR